MELRSAHQPSTVDFELLMTSSIDSPQAQCLTVGRTLLHTLPGRSKARPPVTDPFTSVLKPLIHVELEVQHLSPVGELLLTRVEECMRRPGVYSGVQSSCVESLLGERRPVPKLAIAPLVKAASPPMPLAGELPH